MGEEALAILDAGQYFGEMGVVEESVRSADAYAHETATLWRIDRQRFDQLLFTDKDLAYAVLWTLVRTLSGRLRETNEKMKAFFAMSQF
jgi:CRP-like cAMP-binding protein